MKQKFQTLKKAIDGKLHWIVGAVIVIQPALDVLSYFLGELGNNSFSTGAALPAADGRGPAGLCGQR